MAKLLSSHTQERNVCASTPTDRVRDTAWPWGPRGRAREKVYGVVLRGRTLLYLIHVLRVQRSKYVLRVVLDFSYILVPRTVRGNSVFSAEFTHDVIKITHDVFRRGLSLTGHAHDGEYAHGKTQ